LLEEVVYPFGDPRTAIASDSAVQERIVACGCASHYDKVEVDDVFQLPVSFVYEGLFGIDAANRQNSLLNGLVARRKLQDYHVAAAEGAAEGNIRVSTATYLVPVNSSMLKEKDTPCIETITVSVAEPHLRYIVDVCAKTPNVPFGDAFELRTRYCMTAEGASACRLKLCITIHFYKSFMLKGVIKSASVKGFSDYTALLVALLHEAARPVGAAPSVFDTDAAGRRGQLLTGDEIKEKERDVDDGLGALFIRQLLSILHIEVSDAAAQGIVTLFQYAYFILSVLAILYSGYVLFIKQPVELDLHSALANLAALPDAQINRAEGLPASAASLPLKQEWTALVLADLNTHYERLLLYSDKLASILAILQNTLASIQATLRQSILLNRLSDDWLICHSGNGSHSDTSAISCSAIQQLYKDLQEEAPE
jgi:VAD1 Analog of StAR-related lipid transfer domain